MKSIPTFIFLSIVCLCALGPWLFPIPPDATRATGRMPPLNELTHLSCAKPVGLKDGVTPRNYILCDDGTQIPLGGNRLNGAFTGLVYRCALEGKSLEVWTYGRIGISYRFVQIICGDRMVLDYAHGSAGAWLGMPSYGRVLQGFVSLAGWISLLIWVLIRMSRLKALS